MKTNCHRTIDKLQSNSSFFSKKKTKKLFENKCMTNILCPSSVKLPTQKTL